MATPSTVETKDFASSEIAKVLKNPESAIAKSDALDSIYILHYRAKYKPEEGHIRAKDLQDAKEKAWAYCKKWNLKYISVRPFFLDIDAPVPDAP